jgi:hypothetical protein
MVVADNLFHGKNRTLDYAGVNGRVLPAEHRHRSGMTETRRASMRTCRSSSRRSSR